MAQKVENSFTEVGELRNVQLVTLSAGEQTASPVK